MSRLRSCHNCWGRQGYRRLVVANTASALPPISFRIRNFAIYAVGEGWTGALTRRHILDNIPGHHDDDEDDDDDDENDDNNGGGENDAATYKNARSLPFPMIYPGDDVQQAAVGWGTSAFVNTQNQVTLVGRPHDVMSLLRMNRMPTILQNMINRHSNPVETTFVGAWISNLIGWAAGTTKTTTTTSSSSQDEDNKWEIAQEYSFLHDWTKMDLRSLSPATVADSSITKIACGPGTMAMIGAQGTLYTTGINSRGQCGVGRISNNVWVPEPVRGLTMSPLPKQHENATTTTLAAPEQDAPVVDVQLGFQQGYALTSDGQVYSWGKAHRGQLGRMVDSDQDAFARPILVPKVAAPQQRDQQQQHQHRDGDRVRVVQIAAGHHHGALLTEENHVFVWGKNMSRGETVVQDAEDGGEEKGSHKLTDATTPEQVLGLPLTDNLDNDNVDNGKTFASTCKKITKISCGSHHTAMLLEDGAVYAVGIASDEPVLLLDPVELIPSGILELPVLFFEAHFDRTTIIDHAGRVYQVHLWNDETLREYALFTPAYVNKLLDRGESIRAIHRGWKHTIIVTE